MDQLAFLVKLLPGLDRHVHTDPVDLTAVPDPHHFVVDTENFSLSLSPFVNVLGRSPVNLVILSEDCLVSPDLGLEHLGDTDITDGLIELDPGRGQRIHVLHDLPGGDLLPHPCDVVGEQGWQLGVLPVHRLEG